ncbi:hypothetical protein [Sphingomonas desiccabilis]|uniref:Uncharacterized protein n=1 Tax=Sphingomonas desiccabilis TaxID=429134 RepID=A0A4V1QPY9_9SPHN|nr:hypothetical protein [Sphingomonas desiccabilis]MBB3910852.1 hypothetical protein [Sphingomonas desiccabilis]RXZ35457.1 hypothetical protein EO081_07520 [Sphingomonas desiccabilis]
MAEGVDLIALEALYRQPPKPLRETEPGGMSLRNPAMAGALTAGLGDDLAMIWTKIAPTASADQADAWIKTMQVALDDLPGKVAREAAQMVLRQPIRFAGDVDGAIREAARDVLARRSRARYRIRELREAIEARQAGRAIEGDTVAPLSPEKIRALTAELRAVGLSIGAITQDQVDAALALEAA